MESKERIDMFNDLADYYKNKKLQTPLCKLVPFDNYREAIASAVSFDGRTGLKCILDMTKS